MVCKHQLLLVKTKQEQVSTAPATTTIGQKRLTCRRRVREACERWSQSRTEEEEHRRAKKRRTTVNHKQTKRRKNLDKQG